MDMQTIGDRFPIIRPFVVGNDVLDLGCVDAHPAREDSDVRLERKPDVLFRRVAEANPSTVGVDIDQDGVTVLTGMGYNVQCADVETMNLERQFDTIVAGEIIEHLENPGLFLRNMLRHLKPDGTIIVSTPNPFYTGQTWKIWRHGLPAVHDEHVNWQDPVTLEQLFSRTGYETVAGYWVQPESKLLKTWKRLLRPYFAHSFMLIARPAAAAKSSAA
ncbi:MAG: class I SAM-dependent methyltransferase [Planctomycetaceae bacterium]|jgi:SAM-dependent methyltransferase|nr:class I SAM-dependent methyltransferase [Planctomycetaceae bacterium]MBT6155951.1 class I SAM-dependent methyltransferase [Planctomycetaceae bacterium]MBT6483134.1 class I SAM-dependent methyltransferase [Planctomycetaceae bacterium]MBT6497736.1 class I SAM-dependent methyltransferase [Planctomycetaceae bacterium]